MSCCVMNAENTLGSPRMECCRPKTKGEGKRMLSAQSASHSKNKETRQIDQWRNEVVWLTRTLGARPSEAALTATLCACSASSIRIRGIATESLRVA